MKSIKKKFFALLLIFFVLNDDLLIQVRANSDLVKFARGNSLSESERERKESSKRKDKQNSPPQQINTQKSHQVTHQTQANNTLTKQTNGKQNDFATKLRRLRESKALMKSKSKTKDFGLTFLILVGVFIVVMAIKFYMDYRVKKQLKYLSEEKHRPAAQTYYQRIEEGSLLTSYCLSLQTLNKLSNAQGILSKINESNLKSLLEKENPENKLKENFEELKTNVKKYLENRKKNPTIDVSKECFNSYRNRVGWSEVLPSITDNGEIDAEDLNNLDVLQDGLETIYGLDIAGKVISSTEMSKATKEKDTIFSKSEEITPKDLEKLRASVAFSSIGNLIDLFNAYQLYKTIKDPNENVVSKIFSVLKWIFNFTHNTLATTQNVQKLLGKTAINIPFFSIGTSVTNMIEKLVSFIQALQAYKTENEKKNDPKLSEIEKKPNPTFELNKIMAFYELIDSLLDSCESIVTTLLKFLTPLTAGVSGLINISINIFIATLHIGLDALKLRAISQLGERISKYYDDLVKYQRESFEKVKASIITKQCAKTVAIVKDFILNNLNKIEKKFAEVKNELLEKSMENGFQEELDKNLKNTLKVVCDTEPEDCLWIIGSEELNLDLESLKKYDSELAKKVDEISTNAKFGSINSAFMITKQISFQQKIEENTKDFLQTFIPRSQSLLLNSGYYPIFQGQNSELWICRTCASNQHRLETISQRKTFEDLKKLAPNSFIQDSVEGFQKAKTETEEIALYFTAQYEILNEQSEKYKYFGFLPEEDNIDKTQVNLKLVRNNTYELNDHDTISILSTNTKHLKSVTDFLLSNKIAVMATVYHAADLVTKHPKLHDNVFVKNLQKTIVTFLLSYNSKIDLDGKIKTTYKEEPVYNTVIEEDIQKIRHNKFLLVTSHYDKGQKVFSNIDSSLINGWSLLKEKETTFTKKHMLIAGGDKDYTFSASVYTKEVIRLTGSTTPPVKSLIKQIKESDEALTKEIISSLNSLYCDRCDEFEKKNKELVFSLPDPFLPPVVVKIKDDNKIESDVKKNPTITFSFCELRDEKGDSPKNFLDLVLKTAKKAAPMLSKEINGSEEINEIKTDNNLDNQNSSDKPTEPNKNKNEEKLKALEIMKKNVCSLPKRLKNEFSIKLLNATIDNLDQKENCEKFFRENMIKSDTHVLNKETPGS